MKKKETWVVMPGQKILNIPGGGKSYYEGDELPEWYNPPKDYIKNRIVQKGGK